MIEATNVGTIKAMFIMGENPVTNFPQPALVQKALSSLEFLVATDIFMTETAGLASVVLPAASFAEKEGTFTNFEGRVQQLRKAVEPAGDSLPDGEIIIQMSRAMGAPLPYTSPPQVAEEIEEMVPFYHRSTYSDVEEAALEPGEMEGDSPGTRRLYNGLFPSGFGRFTSVDYITPPDVTRNGFPLTLVVGSSRYHFGSGTRSSRSARLKRFAPEAFLEINPMDAVNNGINDGDKVRIASARGELVSRIRISTTLPPGVLFMPVSFPAIPVYGLFSNDIDHQAKAPALKSCAVKLERMADDG
jgi:predicted molibdopterin-dependent oxidoreductase YjgC